MGIILMSDLDIHSPLPVRYGTGTPIFVRVHQSNANIVHQSTHTAAPPSESKTVRYFDTFCIFALNYRYTYCVHSTSTCPLWRYATSLEAMYDFK